MQWHQSRMTGIRESLKEKAKLTVTPLPYRTCGTGLKS